MSSSEHFKNTQQRAQGILMYLEDRHHSVEVAVQVTY